tara:strand:+ start:475 stop:1497 length:1023 start_codon:yes stop_codon:yes gene_type:complete
MLNNGINLVRIFSPEHGYLGNYAAGKYINNNIDPLSGVEVISLYGKNKAPMDKYLLDIDILIFDIQDIGVRYYTYASTMTLAMEKAAQNNIDFMVLDRPNPLTERVQGAILDLEFSSFVGMHSIPIRHGMTIAELALFIKENDLIKDSEKLNLEVIKMTNWDKGVWYDSVWENWISPSPNIPDIMTALIYVGTCLLEGTNLSEGRGTNAPFMLFGAPWLDNQKIVQNLNDKKMEGVIFLEENFTPKTSKYSQVQCKGIRIHIKNKEKIDPLIVGMSIINEVYKNHPNEFEFKADFFDKLYGSDDLRVAILESKNIDELMNKNEKDIEVFKKLREKVLLYK